MARSLLRSCCLLCSHAHWGLDMARKGGGVSCTSHRKMHTFVCRILLQAQQLPLPSRVADCRQSADARIAARPCQALLPAEPQLHAVGALAPAARWRVCFTRCWPGPLSL